MGYYRFIEKEYDAWVIGYTPPCVNGFIPQPIVLAVEEYPTIKEVIKWLKENAELETFFMVEWGSFEFDLRGGLWRLEGEPSVEKAHQPKKPPVTRTSRFDTTEWDRILIPDLVKEEIHSRVSGGIKYFYKGKEISCVKANKIISKAWKAARLWMLNGLPDTIHSWKSEEVSKRKECSLSWFKESGISQV